MIRRWVFALTSVSVLHLVALSVTTGWAVAFVVFVARFSGPLNGKGDPVGGDFLVFYTAGRMVAEGNGGSLYDLQAQAEAQRAIVGDDGYGSLAAYVNPPSVATAFAPLTGLPYIVAYVLYSAAALTLFLLGMRLLRPYLPGLHAHWTTVILLGLSFYPVVRTITGGQNTALSFCLMAATYSSLRQRREGLAGVFLGLLFFKPQFALLFAVLLLYRKQVKCVAASVAVAIGHYVVGALVCGIRWPLEMLHTLASFGPLEFIYNGATQASWIGFFEYAWPGRSGTLWGITYVALTVCVLLWLWRTANPAGDSFELHWAVAVAGSVLVSPHTQYYDTGLMLLAVLLLVNRCKASGGSLGGWVRLGLIAAYVLFPAYPLAKSLGWQPLILLPALVFLWAAHQLEQTQRGHWGLPRAVGTT
ncbi:MAG: DUF2029 domain-containing protein [bacterium]|nr:DUF2029 domain-containing protein [bacterium]